MKIPFDKIMTYLAVVVDALYLVVLAAMVAKLIELWG